MEQKNDILDLINASKKNNEKAQVQLYNRYANAMYNVARRIVGNDDDAEDVMQEAFIKAFNKLHTYKTKASFGAWLKRIVINESLTWLRKKKHLRCFDNDEVMLAEPETDFEFEPNRLKIDCMLKAISKLKDNYKLAINLYYIEGYDYEEMMQILELSYANVRTLVSRAKSKLKQILKTDYPDIVKK